MSSVPAKVVMFTQRGVVNVIEENVRTDSLEPMQAVVRNEVSLVSAGTELANLHDVRSDVKYPTRTGYASVGRVLALGSGIRDFAVGDRVLYAGKHASVQVAQHGENHPWCRLYPVPATLDPTDAVYTWLLRISLTAIRVAPPEIDDTVAVFGLGLVGNLAAQVYQAMGLRVICLDPLPERCELARKVGLREVLCLPPTEHVAALLERTGGAGVHIAVDAAGHPSVLRNCVAAAALFGTVLSLGTPRVNVPADQSPDWFTIHDRELTIRSAHEWQFPATDERGVRHSVPANHRLAFDLIGSGKVQLTPLRSHILPPAQAAAAYRGLKEEPGRYWGVVFDWRNV
jgi:threonine dehydrogenase-like Zn-dependent dehydrogenase